MGDKLTKKDIDEFVKDFTKYLIANNILNEKLNNTKLKEFENIFTQDIENEVNNNSLDDIGYGFAKNLLNNPKYQKYLSPKYNQKKSNKKKEDADLIKRIGNNEKLQNLFSKKKQFYIVSGVFIAITIVLAIVSILTDNVTAFIFSAIFCLVSIFFVTSYINNKKETIVADPLPSAIKLPVLFLAIALFILFYYFIVLPPLSLQNGSFILFITISSLLIGSYLCYLIYKIFSKRNINIHRLLKWTLSSLLIIPIAYSIIGGLTSATLFVAKDLANLLEIEKITDKVVSNADFDYKNGDVILPLLDKTMAKRQAEIALGDYGNQYFISQNHFNIQTMNDNGVQKMIRVVPLEYSNFFLSMQNNKTGTPGYIYVDLVTGESKLVSDYPLVYCESAKLYSDLYRHIRLNNIYDQFDNYYFEIDDNYHPYWVVPCYEKRVGVFGGKFPSKVITVAADTGEVSSYKIEDAPSWIDNVVDLPIVESLAQYNFKYKKGFINATIGTKEDVFIINDGYNYFIKNGEPFYVSSVTSSDERDQTSIGFVTFSLRTMKAKFYSSIGVTENRAMEIARLDGSVKAMNLTATWPVYITINNTPTYFLTLENDVKVQKYVFINQSTGENPIIDDNFDLAYDKYVRSLGEKTDTNTISGNISKKEIVNEYIYFTMEDKENVYRAQLSMNPKLYVMSIGDTISFNYVTDGNLNIVIEINELILK